MILIVALQGMAANDVPAAPSNLILSMNSEFDVELKWNLPATYADGQPFADGSKVSAVKVYRNSSEIALLDGDATTYIDYMEGPGHTDGHGYGLNVYELSACVDNVMERDMHARADNGGRSRYHYSTALGTNSEGYE